MTLAEVTICKIEKVLFFCKQERNLQIQKSSFLQMRFSDFTQHSKGRSSLVQSMLQFNSLKSVCSTQGHISLVLTATLAIGLGGLIVIIFLGIAVIKVGKLIAIIKTN